MLASMPWETLREYLHANLNDPTDEDELDQAVLQAMEEIRKLDNAPTDIPMHTNVTDPLPSTSHNPPQ